MFLNNENDGKNNIRENQDIQIALRERIKELTCLYGISKISDNPDVPLDHILQNIVELLPPAWQFPEIASARIKLWDKIFTTGSFNDKGKSQKADIVISGNKEGSVEIFYDSGESYMDGNPFLEEEEKLIQEIARQIGIIVERRKAEEEKTRLHEQLLHADRLATIGQLSAGIAHELNEPLNNILGFSQLIKKSEGLQEQVKSDIEKIIKSSLFAREIIRKLLIFSRQLPNKKDKLNINEIVKDGVSFLSLQCNKYKINLELELDGNLPEIIADASQLIQVIVNLGINAIQAMEEKGGKLLIKTFSYKEYIFIEIEDTGIGMNEDIRKRIFLPFFTTKDIDKGTGLGLSVVHGIITSHGGAIDVESHYGKGTRFIIKLPDS